MSRISEASQRVASSRLAAESALARVHARRVSLGERLGRINPLLLLGGAALAGAIAGRLLPASRLKRTITSGAPMKMLARLGSLASGAVALFARVQALAAASAEPTAAHGDDRPS